VHGGSDRQSADESDRHLRLIKGGGGALTREKIVAAVSDKFVCIVDDTKLVDVLGEFPLPVEVIPMARSYVARRLAALGGQPVWRADCVTDNGNWILDAKLDPPIDARSLEAAIAAIPGVVGTGFFLGMTDAVIVGDGERVEVRRASDRP